MRIDRRILPGTTFDPTGASAIIHANQTAANARGTSAVDLQSSRTAVTQVASGGYSFIGSGQNNTVSGGQSGVLCGSTNSVLSDDSAIITGANNTVSSSGASNIIAAGASNTISGIGAANAIVTGVLCTLSSTAVACATVTGLNNNISSGSYSAIVAAANCLMAGNSSAIVAGDSCVLAGDYCGIVSGFGHTLSGFGSAILSGVTCSVAHSGAAILCGANVQTESNYQLAWGGIGFGNVKGTGQASKFVFNSATTNATPQIITLDGGAASATNQVKVPTDRTLAVTVMISAMQQRTDGSASASFWRRLLIQNLNGTTALVGSVQTIGTDIGSNAGSPPAGWAVSITADNTNDVMNITVTGAAATDIRWVANVETTQVGYT